MVTSGEAGVRLAKGQGPSLDPDPVPSVGQTYSDLHLVEVLHQQEVTSAVHGILDLLVLR